MTRQQPIASAPAHGAPFRRILCAVDGSDEATVGLQQAIALAGSDATIAVTAVWSEDTPLARVAWDVVDQAVATALAAGATAIHRLIKSPSAVDALLTAALGHDLVVVGTHPHARVAGIVLGETATTLVHRSPVPVLVARATPLATGVLAATDGRPHARGALTAAALIASRLDAALTVLHVREVDEQLRRHELEAELANARALLGRDLRYVADLGGAAPRIVAAAEQDATGLVVVGSAAKRGVVALGSTSERVAHLAPCSVLVMREP